MAGRPLHRLRTKRNSGSTATAIIRIASQFGFVVRQPDVATLTFHESYQISSDQLPGLHKLGTVKLIGPAEFQFIGFGVRAPGQFQLGAAPNVAQTVNTIVQLASQRSPVLSWAAIAHRVGCASGHSTRTNPPTPAQKDALRRERLEARLAPWIGRRVTVQEEAYLVNRYGPLPPKVGVVTGTSWCAQYPGDSDGAPMLHINVKDSEGYTRQETVIGEPAGTAAEMFPLVTVIE